MLGPGYTWEDLGKGLRIAVTPDHKFGTDAFLLSDFAAPRRKDTACDLCAGCGIVAALWFRREDTSPQRAYAVEIQPEAAAQLEASVRQGGLPEDRFVPVQGDLRGIRGLLPQGRFDLVSCNPPYKPAGTGILSREDPARAARHETMCTLEDVCRAAQYLLRYRGRLCICQRPERLADALGQMRAHRIEPKRLRFVQQRPESPPWLFLLEGKLGAKPFLQVEAPLLIEGEGGFSKEVLRIYQKEKNK